MFRAIADRALASEEIVHWWGADGVYKTTEWTGDVRPGGRWRASGVEADGKPFAVEGGASGSSRRKTKAR